MNQIKDKTIAYETKFNLSTLYTSEDFKKLFQIIPELSNLYFLSNNPNYSKKTLIKENQENICSQNYQTKINKFYFFKIILSKLKSYFEINESFIIIKTISILINEINNLEKFFSHSSSNYFSHKELKSEQKSEKKNEKENNSYQKIEKVKNINYKGAPNNKIIIQKNNGLNKTNFNSSESSLNPFEIIKTKKKKVYFRGIDNSIKREYKTEVNSFCSKFTYNNKKFKKIIINDSKKKNSNDFSISDLKKYEFQKQKTTSDLGLKIYIDSNNDSNFHNCSTNFDINNNYSSNNKVKKKFINTENKGDLFNNNNNLYINIYEQKKNIGNSLETSSLNHQSKTSEEINIEKDNPINDLLNVSLLNNVETEDFNIFELDKRSSKKSLVLIGCYIFNRFGFHNIMKYSMFENWCRKIAQGYNRKNPYHTDLHAADVTQTCLTFFKIGKVNEFCKLNQLSKCSLFLSCICHDYKHPGVNNNFLKDTKNILAIKYNDKSILENMHISEAFKLTIDFSNCDIFSGMNSDNYKQMRKEMISCVLFTDVINHDLGIDFMKSIINKKKNKSDKVEEKDIHQNYMNLLIHSADISNPTKKFDIYWEWAKFVVEEFLMQGDKEKELGLQCSFDRDTLTVFQNQLSFINYIELPFYTLFVDCFPKLKYLLDNLNNNKTQLISLQEKEKGRKNKKEKNENKQ